MMIKRTWAWCMITILAVGIPAVCSSGNGLPDENSGLESEYTFSGCSPESEVNLTEVYSVSEESIESVVVREGVVYAGSSDGVLSIVDIKAGAIRNLSLGMGINAISLSSDGYHLAAGLSNGTIYVLNTSSLTVSHTLFHGSTNIWSLAFMRDRLISGGGDRQIIFWDINTWQKSSVVKASSSVRAISVQRNGDIAIGLYNGVVSLILNGSHELIELYTHSSIVRSLAWSNDGSRLASVSSDKTLRLWRNGQALSINASRSGVFGVAWMGERVITAGTDGHIKIWDTNGSQLRDIKLGSSVHSVDGEIGIIAAGDIHGKITLLRDMIPPSPASTSLDGTRSNSTKITFTVRFTECIHAGGIEINPPNPLKGFNLTINNNTLAGVLYLNTNASDGEYLVILTDIRDLANNSIERMEVGRFVLDRAPPEVTAVTQSRPSPFPIGDTDMRIIFSEEMYPEIEATLMHGTSSYGFIPTTWSKNNTMLTLTIHMSAEMPSGNYTFVLAGGCDIAGNHMNPFEHTFSYDGEPPIAIAGEDMIVNAGEVVTFDASNSLGASKFIWHIAGRNYTGKVVQHRFNIPEEYLITLTVFDDAGNKDSDSLTVHVLDNDLPNISIERPKKLTNHTDIVIKYNITDNGGVSSVDLLVHDGSSQRINHRSYEKRNSVEDLIEVHLPKDGSYNLSLRACDYSGHCNTSEPFEMILDSAPPQMLSYLVSSGGDITFDFIFSEKVEVKEIKSQNSIPTVIISYGENIKLRLNDMAEGENTMLTMRVNDMAGNSNTVNLSIKVTDNDIVASWVGFFAAGFTAGFLVFQFITKRKYPPVRTNKHYKRCLTGKEFTPEDAVRGLKAIIPHTEGDIST